MKSGSFAACCLAVSSVLSAQSPSIPIQEVHSHTLNLREVTRLGSLEGLDDAFGRVRGIVLDESLRMFVVDALSHEVRVFDRDGRLLQIIGREGRGPGEFKSPWRVAIDPTDSVWVWDQTLQRFSVFDEDGAFARSFNAPGRWLINSLQFLPTGELLVAAFGRSEGHGLHVVTLEGAKVRDFLRLSVDPSMYPGFVGSLMGGSADWALGGGIVYARKSPYQLTMLDMDGNETRSCTGAESWATPPMEVVEKTGDGYRLHWDQYKHVSRVLAIPGVGYLVVVSDLPNQMMILDVVTADCRLLARSVREGIFGVRALRDGYLAVSTTESEFPEVVVYRLSVEPAR